MDFDMKQYEKKTGCQTDKNTKKDRNIYYIFVNKEGYTVTVFKVQRNKLICTYTTHIRTLTQLTKYLNNSSSTKLSMFILFFKLLHILKYYALKFIFFRDLRTLKTGLD